LQQAGIRVEQVLGEGEEQRPSLRAVLRRLAELEITSVLIEGGATVNGAALAANVVDKVFLYYAPRIFGAHAVPFAKSADFQSAPLKRVRLHRFGDDFAVEGYLRDPYEE
jgi:diaminohydroxyphosphoribosylaminopyrimidine deaminase/5-amino-6-(5-phosphoribosylamino)uracil reductase